MPEIKPEVKKAVIVFVLIPFLVNGSLMAMYFSGIDGLQSIVAPTIDWLPRNSWREFGLLEMLQNLVLLAVIAILIAGAFNKRSLLDRLSLVVGAAAFLFLFLEEIDYGIHFYEYITGQPSEITVRNWHNQKTGGKQNVKRFKQLMDVIMVTLFILLPLLKNRISIGFLRRVAPSRWFIAGFAVVFVMSRIAHLLDDQGLGGSNGMEGHLAGNISEFRELGNYYFFMLYALQLARMKTLFGTAGDKTPSD